jgi:hypothetical protein
MRPLGASRSIQFALRQRWGGNPNYSSGASAKRRAGAETKLREAITALPALYARCGPVRHMRVIRQMMGELEASNPAEWTRQAPTLPLGLHLPDDAVAAALAFVRRVARLRRWAAIFLAKLRPFRAPMAQAPAQDKTRREAETSSSRDPEREKARLRAWAASQGLSTGF